VALTLELSEEVADLPNNLLFFFLKLVSAAEQFINIFCLLDFHPGFEDPLHEVGLFHDRVLF
jgi:hypothetical protein